MSATKRQQGNRKLMFEFIVSACLLLYTTVMTLHLSSAAHMHLYQHICCQYWTVEYIIRPKPKSGACLGIGSPCLHVAMSAYCFKIRAVPLK